MAEASFNHPPNPERPLSPHLQVYRPLINMVMSIVHRLTGVALYVGALGLTWWLFAAAHGPDYYSYVASWFETLPGQIILFGYTWALMHHMLGGIRHFIWDFGVGYDLKTVDLLSWGTLVLSVLATALIWFVVCTSSSATGVELVSRAI